MPKRQPLVAGNWKMNLGYQDARGLAKACAGIADEVPSVEVAVFPAMLHVLGVQEFVAGSNLRVGAQNCHERVSGAFTGEVSPVQLRDAGIGMVLLGHSERRQEFGEQDETIERKLMLALDSGLRVVLCVGETLEQREEGETLSIVRRQMAALERVNAAKRERVEVAYEPVWAIGTGKTATPQQAQEVHLAIRATLDKFGGYEKTRVLYGGSVKPENAAALAAQGEISGFLVGGASLKTEEFRAIVHAAAEANE